MTRETTNGIWKWTATGLLGLMAGLVAAVWASADKPSTEEVRGMIVREAPYLKESGTIKQRIEHNREAIDKNADAIQDLRGDIKDLEAQQRVQTQRIIDEIRQQSR